MSDSLPQDSARLPSLAEKKRAMLEALKKGKDASAPAPAPPPPAPPPAPPPDPPVAKRGGRKAKFGHLPPGEREAAESEAHRKRMAEYMARRRASKGLPPKPTRAEQGKPPIGTPFGRVLSAKQVLENPANRKGILDLELPNAVPAPVSAFDLDLGHAALESAPPGGAPAPPDDPVPVVAAQGVRAVAVVEPPAAQARAGRPAHVTPAEVYKLGQLCCTQDEAAGWFRIPKTAFAKLLREDEEITEAWDNGQQSGRVSFRRLQLAAAEGGSAPMMIFLGKNLLGQKDNAALQVNTTDSSADRQVVIDRLMKAAEKMAARGRGETE